MKDETAPQSMTYASLIPGDSVIVYPWYNGWATVYAVQPVGASLVKVVTDKINFIGSTGDTILCKPAPRS
jgi:hypothetical protein